MRCDAMQSALQHSKSDDDGRKQGDTTPPPPSAEEDGLFNLSGPSQDGKVTRGARGRDTTRTRTEHRPGRAVF